MIIKGKSLRSPQWLARHLMASVNERADVVDALCRDTATNDTKLALLELAAHAAATRCENSIYHASVSPDEAHRLNPDQWAHAVDMLEKQLGLDGHARHVVMHKKLGREHMHVVWTRINPETGRAWSDSHNYKKHEQASRQLERDFGHEHVQGVHVRDPDTPRPPRTPPQQEYQQAEKNGFRLSDLREELRAIYETSDSGRAFIAALNERDMVLARGDRRDFVLIDPHGAIHNPARLVKERVKDFRAFMKDVEREKLPSVDEAKEWQRQLVAQRAQDYSSMSMHGEALIHEAQLHEQYAMEGARQMAYAVEKAKQEARHQEEEQQRRLRQQNPDDEKSRINWKDYAHPYELRYDPPQLINGFEKKRRTSGHHETNKTYFGTTYQTSRKTDQQQQTQPPRGDRPMRSDETASGRVARESSDRVRRYAEQVERMKAQEKAQETNRQHQRQQQKQRDRGRER